jgi:hypothetical protein
VRARLVKEKKLKLLGIHQAFIRDSARTIVVAKYMPSFFRFLMVTWGNGARFASL